MARVKVRTLAKMYGFGGLHDAGTILEVDESEADSPVLERLPGEPVPAAKAKPKAKSKSTDKLDAFDGDEPEAEALL